MTDTVLRIRPQALADYFHQRYRVQPGRGLCLVLGEPEGNDNHQALASWVEDALDRHKGIEPCEQVQAVEGELCRLMIDAGIVDEPVQGYPVPAGLVARIFGASANDQAHRSSRRASGRHAHSAGSNVIAFPGRNERG